VTECPQGALILKKRSGAKEIHSQGRTKEMAVKIDKEKCTGCGSCVEVCSVEALSLVDNLAVVDPDLCVECGVCVDECPVEAISLP
jgi:NAD-dependent dihydropyrimidine dehydrogenase PreA subunit